MTTLRYEEIIRDKLHFFSDRNISVHLKLNIVLPNGKNKFHNGFIKNYFDNFIEFDDEKLGIIPIHFSEILDIEKREEEK